MSVRGGALTADGTQFGCSAESVPGAVQHLRLESTRTEYRPKTWRDARTAPISKLVKDSTKHMAQTLTKNIRVTPEQWERIEKAAEDRGNSANQLVVELTMETLDRREWPRKRQ